VDFGFVSQKKTQQLQKKTIDWKQKLCMSYEDQYCWTSGCWTCQSTRKHNKE